MIIECTWFTVRIPGTDDKPALLFHADSGLKQPGRSRPQPPFPMAVTHHVTGDQLTYVTSYLLYYGMYSCFGWVGGGLDPTYTCIHLHFLQILNGVRGLYDGQMGSPPSPPLHPSIPPSLHLYLSIKSVCLYMYLSPSLNRWTPEYTGTLLICCTHAHTKTHIYIHILRSLICFTRIQQQLRDVLSPTPPPQPSPGCTVRYFWLSTKSSTKQECHEFSHPAFLPPSLSVLIHIMKSSTLMVLRGCKADKDGCRSGGKMMLYASLPPQCCLMHSAAVYIQFARFAFAF